ncbi:MAG: DNA-directed RNA polymerase subunit omega [Christensenellaceae bacterium]|nr:DNA-directed RNA polymerase subunit omega [Christensenellaceae bacterium]
MIEPELDKILEKVDCRYTLVVETAKRARQLVDGAQALTEDPDPNPVTEAVKEIYEEKVTYVRHSNTND